MNFDLKGAFLRWKLILGAQNKSPVSTPEQAISSYYADGDYSSGSLLRYNTAKESHMSYRSLLFAPCPSGAPTQRARVNGLPATL